MEYQKERDDQAGQADREIGDAVEAGKFPVPDRQRPRGRPYPGVVPSEENAQEDDLPCCSLKIQAKFKNSKRGPDDQEPAWDSTGFVAMTPIQFASDVHKSGFLLPPGRRWSIQIAGPKTDLPCLTHAFQLGLSRKISD